MDPRSASPISKDTHTKKGSTPLHLAVLQNNVEMVESLINSGAETVRKNSLGQTAFELACELGYYDCAEKFENQLSCYVDTTDGKYGRLFLYAINNYDKLDLAKRLHQAGASTAARTRKDEYTPLHLAAVQYRAEAVDFLLSINSRLSARDMYGRTPISLACVKESWECAHRLIASVDQAKTSSDELANLKLDSALSSAISKKQITTIKLLLKHGASANLHSEYFGNSALWRAIIDCDDKPEILILLLEHGADPNMRNKGGKNMREIAIECKRVSSANILASYDTGPAPETVKGFVTEIDQCFEKLYSSALNTFETLFHLVIYQRMIHDLFALDIKALSAKRNVLNLHREEQKSEIEILDNQILTLQHLQNYPDTKVNLDERLSHTAVGCHIADHLKRLEYIQHYHGRVKEYLLALNARMNDKHWQIKSFLDVFSNKWHEGTPKHIQLIKAELSKLTAESSIADTLIIYLQASKILQQIRPDSCRHVETSAFYLQEKQHIAALHFMPRVEALAVKVSPMPNSNNY